MLEKYHNFIFKVKEVSSNSVSEYHKIKICGKKLDDEAYIYSTIQRIVEEIILFIYKIDISILM